LRGTGYKKVLFPINNTQHATRNSDMVSDKCRCRVNMCRIEVL